MNKILYLGAHLWINTFNKGQNEKGQRRRKKFGSKKVKKYKKIIKNKKEECVEQKYYSCLPGSVKMIIFKPKLLSS